MLSHVSKTNELIEIEAAMKSDLKAMKLDTLRKLISQELNNSKKKLGLYTDSGASKLMRKVSLNIGRCKFALISEDNVKFASGEIRNQRGKY